MFLLPFIAGGRGGIQHVLRHRHHPQPDVQEGGRRAAQEQALQRAHDVPHEGERQICPQRERRHIHSLHPLCTVCPAKTTWSSQFAG